MHNGKYPSFDDIATNKYAMKINQTLMLFQQFFKSHVLNLVNSYFQTQ